MYFAAPIISIIGTVSEFNKAEKTGIINTGEYATDVRPSPVFLSRTPAYLSPVPLTDAQNVSIQDRVRLPCYASVHQSRAGAQLGRTHYRPRSGKAQGDRLTRGLGVELDLPPSSG